MSNIEEIYDKIQSLYPYPINFTASELSQNIRLSRSMTSNYLNQLTRQGFLSKENTRPVTFALSEHKSVFSDVIGNEKSMSTVIEQCKASVNYPPDGLPIIFRGNSGVGKSMLAQKVYQYAKEKRVIAKDAPFVTLNCADYANNPELLSSTLFGYVKGAFTGADSEKEGLLDNADGGYLFLDEVHNLTHENQEKLFILLDQKRFRRLGAEGEWNKANIRLILATTEDTGSHFLTTFRRRFPVEIILPDFKDRSRNERLEFIKHFFEIESEKMNKDILLHPDLLEELVYSDFAGNIGTVQNKIRMNCAQSYNKQSLHRKVVVPYGAEGELINVCTISNQFSFVEIDLQKILSDHFDNQSFNEVETNIDGLIQLLKRDGLKENELANLGEQSIYLKLKENYTNLSRFGKKFTETHLKDLSILINVLYNYTSIEVRPIENKADVKYLNMAQVILEAASQVNERLLEYSIAAYLKNHLPINSQKNAIILMHGKQSASSLSSEANNLVGDYIFEAFDMPIQVETKEIVRRVNEYVAHLNTRDGLILLVDMGSLEKMYEEIKDNVAGDLLIMNNVSTSLAIHTGFALLQGKPMEYFMEMNYEPFSVKPQYFEGISQFQNIIISCMAGEVIAQKIKEILHSYTPKFQVDIVVLETEELEEMLKQDKYSAFKNTLAIISTSQFTIQGVTCINIENLLNGSQSLEFLENLYATDQIRECTNEIIKLFTIEGASNRLKFLNPDIVINEVEGIISSLEKRYHVTFKNFIRVNLFLHLSSMIERLLIGDHAGNDEKVSEELSEFIEVAKEIFFSIREKYNIDIPLKEYDYVYRIIHAE